MEDSKPNNTGGLLLCIKLLILLAAGNLLAWLIPRGGGFLKAIAQSDKVTVWAQTALTVAALITSWVLWSLQARQARLMQRQSLMPHLTFQINLSRRDAPHIQIELLNDGLGPAIIQSIRVAFDGVPIEGGTSAFAHELGDHLEREIEDSDWEAQFTHLDSGDWIPSGGKFILVSAKIDKPELLQDWWTRPNPRINIEVNRFRVDVSYESVFQERVFQTTPWILGFTDPAIPR